MIDVMDKHFQDELGLTKSQSAWVQFAHYLGYFLMSMPAGWLATKLGYKGGIIMGLLIVAAGGFWFIPATHINSMVHTGRCRPIWRSWHFLVGSVPDCDRSDLPRNHCEPVYDGARGPALRSHANQPGAVVQRRRLDLRSHHRQPVFLRQGCAGKSTGSQTLYIPYVGGGRVVIVLAAVFYFANVPDIKTRTSTTSTTPARRVSHSIWSHPHFVLAVAAQFFYVAAQAGIFSFFINYMISELPAIPAACESG